MLHLYLLGELGKGSVIGMAGKGGLLLGDIGILKCRVLQGEHIQAA